MSCDIDLIAFAADDAKQEILQGGVVSVGICPVFLPDCILLPAKFLLTQVHHLLHLLQSDSTVMPDDFAGIWRDCCHPAVLFPFAGQQRSFRHRLNLTDFHPL